MARRVLLVDPDLDALGELAASLRGHGFTVLLADNIASALVKRAWSSPDIILASRELCHPGELGDQLKADPELAKVRVARAGDATKARLAPPGLRAPRRSRKSS